MTALTIADLSNAKLDVDHIADVSNSLADTAIDRSGNTKLTVAGAINSIKTFNYRGDFEAAAVYATKDIYTDGGISYVAVLAHTSTTVAADLAAGKTVIHQGLVHADIANIKKKNATLVASGMLKIRAGTAVNVSQGDSLTYGHDTISGETIPAVLPHSAPHVYMPYPETLQAELNRIYCVSGITVINQGFSGDTALTSYNRWTTNPGADLAFIMLGTNDAKVNGISLADYTKYMAAIIERYNDWGTGVVILTSPSIAQGYGDTPLESYRAAAAALAAQYGCPVFRADVVGQNNAFSDIHSDSVHFNQLGYTLLGNSLGAWVAAGGMGENVVTVSAEKTLLFGLESAAVTNGAYINNAGATAAQGMILKLDVGTAHKATMAFYLDADAAYVSVIGRLSVGSVITIDSNSIRGVVTREGFTGATSAGYTVQTNIVQSEPTNDIFLGQVIGRGWHSITISAPSVASTTPVYLSALRIAPRSQDECFASVFNVTRRSFSVYDPLPQYVGGLLPASSTNAFVLPGALFASLFPLTTAYYMSAFVEITICHTLSGVPSYTRYIVRPASPSTLSATLISSSGANPVTISSITATSILAFPGGTVTINLTRAVAGYMEMRIDVPDIPQLLNAALM